MPILQRRSLILAKIEGTGTYGTDAAPTGAEALQVRNFEATPLNATTVSRDLVRSYLGNSEQLLSATSSAISFEVELAGSGVAGTAPKYDPVLQACALAPSITSGVSVVYAPVSTSIKSATIWANLDGVLHKFLGCRGTMTMSCQLGQIPTLRFELQSLYTVPTDATQLVPTYSLQATPLVFRQGNTSAFSLFSLTTLLLQSVEFSLANEMVYRELISTPAIKEVLIVDRKPSGTAVIEAPTMATRNFFNDATSDTTGGLSFLHGTTAGNRVQFSAGQIDIGAPTYSEMDSVVMLNIPYVAVPTTAGNNELSLAFT